MLSPVFYEQRFLLSWDCKSKKKIKIDLEGTSPDSSGILLA
jgi:hypothetical protein